jgi:hypothetical protein
MSERKTIKKTFEYFNLMTNAVWQLQQANIVLIISKYHRNT